MQNINETNYISQEDIEAINVLVKEIVKAIKGKTINCDRTYQSIIKRVTPKGYVVLDNAGSERTVQCCIPGVELRVGQSVWIKEPCGELKGMHICGVAGK